MIVTDSSPIIFLGKQGELDLLRKCFGTVSIATKVYEEVLKHSESTESIALKKAINEKWIAVKKITIMPLFVTNNLDPGEQEALSLAAKHGCMILTDDEPAKAHAALAQVETHGTFYILYLACTKGILHKKRALKILQRMIADGFYISVEQYSTFTDLLHSLK